MNNTFRFAKKKKKLIQIEILLTENCIVRDTVKIEVK